MAERDETFTIVDAVLVHRVVPKRGTPYQHTCDQTAYEAVAHAIDEMNGRGFTLDDLHTATDLPWTQNAVALAFLKERGCIVPSVRKRHVGATRDVHCDAMIEWHALREKGGEQS